MKKQLLTLICILLTLYGYAQKIEVSIQANSGLFRYAGASTTNNTSIMQASDNKDNYTNNPYSNNNTLSYNFNVQTQLVTKGGFIAGLQTGYDILRSRSGINVVNPYLIFYGINALTSSNYIYSGYSATGNTYLTNEFINLSPYVGYRFKLNQVKLDIMPGMDIAFNVRSHEKGKATANGQEFTTDKDRTGAPTDVRLKLGATAWYKRFGLNTGLAYGLTNYEEALIGGPAYHSHSEYFRFGVSYCIY